MVRKWRIFGYFCALYFQRTACSTATMCGSMVDIQSVTAEIRRGKKVKRKRKKKKTRLQDENIMSASATQGGHKMMSNSEDIVLIKVLH